MFVNNNNARGILRFFLLILHIRINNTGPLSSRRNNPNQSYGLSEDHISIIMKSISLKLTSTLIALFLPLAMSASNPVSADTRTAPDFEDNLASILAQNNEDSTTAFIELDQDALEQLEEAALDSGDELAADIISYAAKHLGTPYRLGSSGPKTFDCSGFTSYVFKKFDIELNRTSRSQFTQGEKVSLDEIKPGDLMFFAGRRGGKTVGHVGMAVDIDENGNVKFIHASTRKGVTYGTLPDDGYYSRRYLGARRVIKN